MTSDGTQDEPWLTITHAASKAVAGDTVTIKTGALFEAIRLQDLVTV